MEHPVHAQVGGFDIGPNAASTTDGDLEGDDTQYGNQVGHGTLVVGDGGLVNIHNSLSVTDPTNNLTGLYLAIGRQGIVQMNGGTINVGGGTGLDQTGQGQGDPITPRCSTTGRSEAAGIFTLVFSTIATWV